MSVQDPKAPRLPQELEKAIFELAVLSHSKEECYDSVIFVAHRSYEWIFPMQFRWLTFQYHTGSVRLKRLLALFEIKPHLASNIKSLLIDHYPYSEDVVEILTLCPNLSRLNFWYYPRGIKQEISECTRRLHSLKRLALDSSVELFSVIGREIDFLNGLSHLEISLVDVHHPEVLSRLPSLTHLAFLCNRDEQAGLSDKAAVILDSCSLLKILVLIFLKPDQHTDRLDSDLRVVFIEDDMNWVEDWNAHSEGRLDYWDRAEEIVNSRDSESYNILL